MDNIALLFQDLHGAIDFKFVRPLPYRKSIGKVLNVNPDFLFENTRGLFQRCFYFDGLVYISLHGSDAKSIKSIYSNDSLLGGNIKQQFKGFITMVHELKEKKHYESLFHFVDKKVLIKVFQSEYQNIPDEEKYEIFTSIYVRNEFGFEMFTKDILKDLFEVQRFKSKAWEERMDSLKRKKGSSFKVYHGINGAYNPNDEMSWTLSRKVAKFFANRFKSNGKIVSKTINLDEVLDYLNSRREEEILLKVN